MDKKKTQALARQIFFCGDNHGRFEHIIEAVQVHSPAAIVLLGDVQAQKPLEQELESILDSTEVWFIHGNHDTDTAEDYDHLFGSALAERNLHGRVVEVAGVRITGLGGIFRGEVWMPPAYDSAQEYLRRAAKAGKSKWRDGLPLKHRSSIFPADYARLVRERADVLVTHEAPSVHPHGFAVLDELGRRLKVNASFHGHHHDSLDYSGNWERVGHQAFGVGFCGVMALDGTVICRGDFDGFDSARKTRSDDKRGVYP